MFEIPGIEVTDQILEELGRPLPLSSTGRKRKPGQLFIKGPVRIGWLARTNVGANTAVVALVVLMLSDMLGLQPVTVPETLWRQLGLSRNARKRALDALEGEAFIPTERSPGRATRIWLLVKP
jgi:hypothetical protein